LWKATLWVLDWEGRLESAKVFFDHRKEIVKVIGSVLTSQAIANAVSIVGVFALVVALIIYFRERKSRRSKNQAYVQPPIPIQGGDSLLKNGQNLTEQWTTRLDYPEKQRRKNDSKNWLSEANEYARNHLTSDQMNKFTLHHNIAAIGSEKYHFAMELMQAGTKTDSEDGELAIEIFGKVKLLEQFRAETTQSNSNIPVECGPNVKGSVVKANGFTFYRARIEPNGSEQFPALIAKLHGIRCDGVQMPLDEVLQIKFYPGDDSAPCARRDDPAFLDVVFVRPNGSADLHVLFWPAGMTHWNFESGHSYQLDIAILSKGTSRRCEFEFVWTGEANTSSCRLVSDGDRKSVGRQRSLEVAAVINDAVRLLRSDSRFCNFPLRALQMAGVGDLQTEEEFSEVREAIIQHNFVDPLVGIPSLYKGRPNTEPKWLEVIKSANRHQVDLSSWSVLMDFINKNSKPSL
jgi:hypothetical protein